MRELCLGCRRAMDHCWCPEVVPFEVGFDLAILNRATTVAAILCWIAAASVARARGLCVGTEPMSIRV